MRLRCSVCGTDGETCALSGESRNDRRYLSRACNSVQGATASLALTACVALWNL
jgi:hypothetical protein